MQKRSLARNENTPKVVLILARLLDVAEHDGYYTDSYQREITDEARDFLKKQFPNVFRPSDLNDVVDDWVLEEKQNAKKKRC